ncbi:MAG: hypothetical protein H6506_02535 [Calditrichaeota bacterium]|nr:hypothetical protein [Calditrichota bacterium]MCB9391510.1 hypothetical protein [Calditrichota bacterium]
MDAPYFEENDEIFVRKPLAAFSFLSIAAIPVFLRIPAILTAIMLLIAGVMTLFVWKLMAMKTLVTSEEFQFGPTIGGKRVRISDVTVYGVEEIPRGAGTGVHRYKGKLYYNARGGRGVAVKISGKEFVVGSGRSEELISALRAAGARHSS